MGGEERKWKEKLMDVTSDTSECIEGKNNPVEGLWWDSRGKDCFRQDGQGLQPAGKLLQRPERDSLTKGKSNGKAREGRKPGTRTECVKRTKLENELDSYYMGLVGHKKELGFYYRNVGNMLEDFEWEVTESDITLERDVWRLDLGQSTVEARRSARRLLATGPKEKRW